MVRNMHHTGSGFTEARKRLKRTKKEGFDANKINKQLLEQEGLIFDVTETICQEMENGKITRAELAKRLGQNERYITKVLEGRNMTIREVADIFTALGVSVNLIARSIADDEILKKHGDQGFVL